MIKQLSPSVWADIGEARPNPSLIAAEGGVILVDSPELPQEAIAWRAFAESKGALRALVMTDHHADKTIGTHFLSPPAVVLANEGCAAAFGSSFKDAAAVRAYIAKVDPAGRQIEDDYVLVAPQMTYRGVCKLNFGEPGAVVMHLPGKVPHQSCLYVPDEGVLIAAGNLTNGIMPMMWEASIIDWIGSLTAMHKLGPEVVVPVHGPVVGSDYILWFRDQLQSWVDQVRDGIGAGHSVDEVAAKVDFTKVFAMRSGREPLLAEWQRRNTIATYEELSGLEKTRFGYFNVGRYPYEAIAR